MHTDGKESLYEAESQRVVGSVMEVIARKRWVRWKISVHRC